MKTKKYFFLILFIFYGIQSYCQNPSDSVKYLTAERTVNRFGKQKIKSRQFGDFRKMGIVLKDGTKITDRIYDFTDSTISVGTLKNIKLTEIQEISSRGSSFLTIVGGSIMMVGIGIILQTMTQTYFPNLNLGGDVFLSGFGIMSIGIINQCTRKHFSIKHGWKYKIVKEPVPIAVKHN